MIGLHKQEQKQSQEPTAAVNLKPVAHDIPKLSDTVIELSKELINIFAQEKELVAKKDTEQHKDLLKFKQRFSAEYSRNIEILYSNKESLQALPDETKKALRDAVMNVETAAQENALMLQASCDASRLFVSNVMSAIKAEQLSPPSYKDTSKTQKDRSHCQPVSISKTV
ncbi:MAG: hypothetical protein FWF23_02630 [Alphaproteobacteria bacterium]|nr:hypothetical protein [Alphaproteobacteria bacterium]MCL2505514.1 hypothetical protein [Alphaproteobacteria bacterium]